MPLDYRGREIIKDENGNRVLHQPTKAIEDCFEIENIAWIIPARHKYNGNPVELYTVSAVRERQVRASNEFIFD